MSCSEPTEEDISFAADLAAFYSKARAEAKVRVVKTQVANLKKIPGAAPGKVSPHVRKLQALPKAIALLSEHGRKSAGVSTEGSSSVCMRSPRQPLPDND